jgi:hypothetical protein
MRCGERGEVEVDSDWSPKHRDLRSAQLILPNSSSYHSFTPVWSACVALHTVVGVTSHVDGEGTRMSSQFVAWLLCLCRASGTLVP